MIKLALCDFLLVVLCGAFAYTFYGRSSYEWDRNILSTMERLYRFAVAECTGTRFGRKTPRSRTGFLAVPGGRIRKNDACSRFPYKTGIVFV